HRIQQGPQLIFNEVQTAINRKYGGTGFGSIPSNLLNPPKVNLPDMQTWTEEEAVEYLKVSGFTYKRGEDVYWDIPAGQIAYTSPAAGSEVPVGTTITYYISKGDGIRFPNIEGMSISDAQ